MKLIYTGYAWREMKPEEIEILTSDRIVAEMTEDARAGDIYDGPDKCLYCIGDAFHNAALIDEDGTLAYIDGHRLRIETFDIDGDPTDVSVKVTYCPKCGRKLEDAE